jgi:hypothetical protein
MYPLSPPLLLSIVIRGNCEVLPMRLKTTKQSAALRQIRAAIEHFYKGDLECVITLAAAAEGLLPPTDYPHVFRDLKRLMTPGELKEFDPNLVINWLKHYKLDDPERVVISGFEAVIFLLRAITKFIAVYRQSTPRLEAFLTWAREHNYPSYQRPEPKRPTLVRIK